MPKNPTFGTSTCIASISTAIVTDVHGKPWWLDPNEGTIRPVKFIPEDAPKQLTSKPE